MKKLLICAILLGAMGACSSGSDKGKVSEIPNSSRQESPNATSEKVLASFNSDSAYSYVARQVEFGPRVPNTEAHRKAGDWLSSELKRHGLEVTEQKADLKAFDGTLLKARNIFASYNPDTSERLLLLAHWDSRPWADEDPDPQKRKLPVDGANDGASGVGVLLEIARLLNLNKPDKGIDILFVDAEDWGNEGDEDSWALGTRYFAEHPPVEGYAPEGAILLDMVGARGATFYREYFSENAAPWLNETLWRTAAALGYREMFPNRVGSAVTDDHNQLIAHGIPAIDIIDYRPGEGFESNWHTTSDNMQGIDRHTLQAVGEVVSAFLFGRPGEH